MGSFDLLIPFFLASAIFACIPGPGMIYMAAQVMAQGRRAGWRAAVGMHVAGYAHILAAAFGLAMLLEATPILYTTIRLAGAAYLIWLGIRWIRAPSAAPATIPAKRRGRAFRDAVTVELLNPKTALFYLAFLPQFADPSAGMPIWAQILVLGGIVNTLFSVTDAVCVLMADRVTRLLKRSAQTSRVLRRVGGSLLIGLGAHLAASRI